MPLGVLARPSFSSTTTTLLSNTPSLSGWSALSAAIVLHFTAFPLISLTDATDLLVCLYRLSSDSDFHAGLATMIKSVRLSKSPIKTSVVRHDECPTQHLDPTCPICQVDIGTRSPEGVKEGYAVTPCGHVFGSVCIKKYLAITDKPQCPFCRTDLFHVCSHPILAVPYDPKKSHLNVEEAAAKAYPTEPQQNDCPYCQNLKLKLAKRIRRQALLEAATRGGSSTSGESEDDSDSETSGSPSRAAKGKRLALNVFHITAALARLTLDAARIRKIKVPPEEQDQIDEYIEDDGDVDRDVIADGSLSTPPNRNLPPVPGPYGHWDLANKGPDWEFLSWFDKQEPKTKTTPDHFS